MLDEMLARSKKRLTFVFPFDVQGAALADLYKNASVESVEYTNDGARVTVLCGEKEAGMYKKYLSEDSVCTVPEE